jgi:hypothetical protein
MLSPAEHWTDTTLTGQRLTGIHPPHGQNSLNVILLFEKEGQGDEAACLPSTRDELPGTCTFSRY